MRYILMHREKAVAEIELDGLSNIINVYDVYASEHLPVGTAVKIPLPNGGRNALYLQAVLD